MPFRSYGKTADEVLIKAMSDGDMNAYAELYERYAPAMRRFVTGLIKNRSKAEDIVQNIFMRLMTSNPVFPDVASFRNWLFVCARNEVISTLRSKWESDVQKVPDYPEVASEGMKPDTVMPMIDSILKKMPEKRSEVFRLNKLEGLSAEEIAARMGISVRTVQKHLEVANRDIRKNLS